MMLVGHGVFYTDKGSGLSVAFQVFCPSSFRLVTVPTGAPPLFPFVMMSALTMCGGMVVMPMSVRPAAPMVMLAVISAVLQRMPFSLGDDSASLSPPLGATRMGLMILFFTEMPGGDFTSGLELSFLFFCAGGEEGDGGMLCLVALGLLFVLFPLVIGLGGV